MNILAGIMEQERNNFQLRAHFCWVKHGAAGLAEDRKLQTLSPMLETLSSTWNTRSNLKWCRSSKLLSIPNQLKPEEFPVKTWGQISGEKNSSVRNLIMYKETGTSYRILFEIEDCWNKILITYFCLEEKLFASRLAVAQSQILDSVNLSLFFWWQYCNCILEDLSPLPCSFVLRKSHSRAETHSAVSCSPTPITLLLRLSWWVGSGTLSRILIFTISLVL